MKKILINIGVSLLLIFFGWKIADKGDKIISKEDLRELQNLCENADVTTGKLKGSYKEIDVSIGKLKSKLYEFTYNYTVNGNTYTASYTTNTKIAKDSVNIWYHKSNPGENSTTNPCDDLVRAKKEKKSGNNSYYYIGGILMILFGSALAWNSIKQIIRTIFGKRKQKTTL